jgi:hypothetical protein
MYSIGDKLNFIKELGKNMGNVSRATIDYNKKYTKEGEFPLNRITIYKWLNDNTILQNGMTFKDFVDEVEAKMVDDADSFLKSEAIIKNNLKAICFLLKHRHPEYKQKLQVDTGEKQLADEAIEKLNKLMSKFENNDNGN